MRFAGPAVAAGLTLSFAPPGHASDDPAEPCAASGRFDRPCDAHATYGLLVENDKWSGTDRHYTSGLRVSRTSGETVAEWPATAGRWIPGFADGGRYRWSASIGHSLFTPADIAATAPLPGQRPYAGWLYATFGLSADAGDRLDAVEVSLGVVGTRAQGEYVQNNWHALIDVSPAQGWHNQLASEVAATVSYERTWRSAVAPSLLGLEADLLPRLGATLGNVFVYADAGLMVRVGQDLRADYGPARIRPGPGAGTFFNPGRAFGWYVFAGAEGRAVGRNIFLDGSTFASGPRVERSDFVADLHAGLAVSIGAVRIAFTHVYRTREFEGQEEADQFDSLHLSVRW